MLLRGWFGMQGFYFSITVLRCDTDQERGFLHWWFLISVNNEYQQCYIDWTELLALHTSFLTTHSWHAAGDNNK